MAKMSTINTVKVSVEAGSFYMSTMFYRDNVIRFLSGTVILSDIQHPYLSVTTRDYYTVPNTDNCGTGNVEPFGEMNTELLL